MYDVPYTWNLKKSKLIETESRLVVASVGKGVREMDKGGYRIQTSSCKINKFWGCNEQHGNYS